MPKQTRQRTCIVCRATDAKSSFLRIVRTPEGEVCFDPSGRKNGRGAYVCGVACLEKALSTKRLDSALRIKVTDADRDRIAQEVCTALSYNEE